ELLAPDHEPTGSAPAPGPQESAQAGRPGVRRRPDESGDFEVESSDRAPQVPTPPATTVPGPEWLQLRREPDDVAFPVVQDQPPESRSPAPGPAGLQSQPPPARSWVWDDSDDEPDGDDRDDQIESIDETDAGRTQDPNASGRRARRSSQ